MGGHRGQSGTKSVCEMLGGEDLLGGLVFYLLRWGWCITRSRSVLVICTIDMFVMTECAQLEARSWSLRTLLRFKAAESFGRTARHVQKSTIKSKRRENYQQNVGHVIIEMRQSPPIPHLSQQLFISVPNSVLIICSVIWQFPPRGN